MTRVVAVAASARLLVLILSFGTNDVFYWERIATSVAADGLMQTYRTLPDLNHPPVAAVVVTGLHQASLLFGVPFSWLLKSPAIVADALSAVLIWRIVLQRSGVRDAGLSMAAFLLCPAVVVLSAYHGNTDSIIGFLLLAGAWAASRDRWVWAGFLLGAAVNVKLLAIAGVVGVVFSARTHREVRQLAMGAAVTIVPFLLALGADHSIFIDKVFGYGPSVEPWGLPWILDGLSTEYVVRRGAAASWYLSHGTVIVTAALFVGAITSRLRRLGVIPAAFIGTAIYLVFTPSIGIQHLAIALPLAFAMPPRVRAFLPVVASLFLIAVYAVFLVNVLPLTTSTGRWPMTVALLGLLVWVSSVLAALRVQLEFRVSATSDDPFDRA